MHVVYASLYVPGSFFGSSQLQSHLSLRCLDWLYSPSSCNLIFLSSSGRKRRKKMKEMWLWIQPVHTWSGWWTMVRELSTKARERAKFYLLLLKLLTLIFRARCQCVEVKPRGWTRNCRGPHETWRMPCRASPFLFGRLSRTRAAETFLDLLTTPDLEALYSPACENMFTCLGKSALQKMDTPPPHQQKMIYVVESAKSPSKNNTSL